MQEQVPSAPVPQDALTDTQYAIVAALCDAAIPSIRPGNPSVSQNGDYLTVSASDYERTKVAISQTTRPDPKEKTLADEYLSEKPTDVPEFKESMVRFIALYVDPDLKKDLLMALNILSYRAGALLLTGRTRPVTELPIAERQAVLHEWSTSYLSMFRDLYRSFTQLATIFWIRTSPTLGRLLTYPKTPINHSFGEAYKFEFIQIPPGDTQEVIETDVVIVGSGCTGGVAASILSKAGLNVLVVDKSYYWAPKYLPMSEDRAAVNLFHNGGITMADSGKFSIVSGSCWGGGGTVNWSASLHLQHAVRQEWSRMSGLPYFTSPAFQADMDAVCERMGVSTQYIEHNAGNKVLLEGARLLGMNGKAVPQNTGGKTHQCGYCTLGCGSCEKRGPTESWLPDAAQYGARFVEGLACERVVFDGKRAVGVEAVWSSRGTNSFPQGPGFYRRKVLIRARKAVIVASGAIMTPVLLKRSGLKNPHIGSHLHLHPVSILGANHPKPTNPWEGAILTSVVTDLENLDGQYHGVKLEATTMLPGWFIPQFPWLGGQDIKELTARMAHATGYISLARDLSEGKIDPHPTDPNRARVAYTVNNTDRKHIAAGLEALAKINYAMGATEIFVSVAGVPRFVRSKPVSDEDLQGVNDPAFQGWLDKYIRPMMRKGHPAGAGFASAHQMGSCRMGATESNSAVDGKGRIWGKKGLYVLDTSVFPAASGVNPMITGMGVARGIARGIAMEAAKL